MNRFTRTMTTAVLATALGLLGGCADGLRFAPSEEIKDAAAIARADLAAMAGHVDPVGEQARGEATAAIEAVQAYVGLPATPPRAAAAANAATIAAAAAEGARRPAPIDAVAAGLDEADFWYEQLAPLLVGVPGLAAAGLAIRRGKQITTAYRDRDAAARSAEQIVQQNQAILDGPLGQLPVAVGDQSKTVAEMMKMVYAGQDGQTRAVVAAAKSAPADA